MQLTPYLVLSTTFQSKPAQRSRGPTRQQHRLRCIASQLHVVGDEWLLVRVQAQRWMPQTLEVNHRFVAVHKRRAARRFPERRGRLRQTEQTVQLGEHAHSAQPQRAVVVKLSVQAELEGFDSGCTVFLRFLQFAYPFLE